jgi:hypothetical protein
MLIAVLDKPAVRPLKGVLHRTYRRRTRTLKERLSLESSRSTC